MTVSAFAAGICVSAGGVHGQEWTVDFAVKCDGGLGAGGESGKALDVGWLLS